jgi:hypothetical protein
MRDRFRWLTVISWKYDRGARNGMPPQGTNEKRLALEQVMDALEESTLCRHAYSRTGNGLKEVVYYISDRETFIRAFTSRSCAPCSRRFDRPTPADRCLNLK